MHIHAVTQMRIRIGSQKPSPKPPPPAWFNLHIETVDYGAATIDLARNNVYLDCNSSIIPGVNNLEDGVIVVCGLPLLKDVYPKSTVTEAIQALKTADGFFAAVGYIPEQDKLFVMTDFMGFMSIFVYQAIGELVISTSTTGMTKEPDLAGWGAFLSMGHTIGKQSLAQGVQRLRPGVVQILDVSGKILVSDRYYQLSEGRHSISTEEVADCLYANARAYISVIDEMSILLSGGFDSRLILCVLKNIGIGCDAVIVSHRDEYANNDGYLARRIAKKFGMKATYYEPPRDFFSTNDYLNWVQMTDCCAPSLYLFITQVAGYVPQCGVWEGLNPGYALVEGPHVPKVANYDSYFAQECSGIDDPPWIAAKKLFDKRLLSEMWRGFHDDVRTELGKYPETHHGIWRSVVVNRMLHRTVQTPLKAYSNKSVPLLLGASQKFWALASAIPIEQRRNHSFYKSLFLNEFPEGTKIPFQSGNTLTKAGGWSLEKGIRDILGKGHQWFQNRPRKARLLGLNPTRFEPSSFLDHPALFEPEDKDLLNWGSIYKHKANDSLNDADRALLFYWKVWRWVQEGNLFKKLQ